MGPIQVAGRQSGQLGAAVRGRRLGGRFPCPRFVRRAQAGGEDRYCTEPLTDIRPVCHVHVMSTFPDCFDVNVRYASETWSAGNSWVTSRRTGSPSE
jgi:hypothetical protein